MLDNTNLKNKILQPSYFLKNQKNRKINNEKRLNSLSVNIKKSKNYKTKSLVLIKKKKSLKNLMYFLNFEKELKKKKDSKTKNLHNLKLKTIIKTKIFKKKCVSFPKKLLAVGKKKMLFDLRENNENLKKKINLKKKANINLKNEKKNIKNQNNFREFYENLKKLNLNKKFKKDFFSAKTKEIFDKIKKKTKIMKNLKFFLLNKSKFSEVFKEKYYRIIFENEFYSLKQEINFKKYTNQNLVSKKFLIINEKKKFGILKGKNFEENMIKDKIDNLHQNYSELYI